MANVTIKGKEGGLEIELSEKATYPSLREELLNKMRKHPTFFKDTDMRVVVRGKFLSPAQRKELRRVFVMDFGIKDVLFGDEADMQREIKKRIESAHKAALQPPAAPPDPETKLNVKVEPRVDSMLVKGPIRNGKRIDAVGDVVILGDVNPGSEIIAGGSIAVFGKLRGLAHAGCRTEDPKAQDAVIAAIDLSPKQLRIAGQIISFSEDRAGNGPEIAWLDANGQLQIRPIDKVH